VRGMCLAIEPMVNIGGGETEMLEDEWTAVTADGSLSAHYELTVAVTEYGPWVLSEPFPYGQEQRAHG
jgi:methionyl aminopeptidase